MTISFKRPGGYPWSLVGAWVSEGRFRLSVVEQGADGTSSEILVIQILDDLMQQISLIQFAKSLLLVSEESGKAGRHARSLQHRCEVSNALFYLHSTVREQVGVSLFVPLQEQEMFRRLRGMGPRAEVELFAKGILNEVPAAWTAD